MLEILSHRHFKTMPWKNGGGTTTELFIIPNGNDFYFRLSCAEVKSDGPFSLFPNVDRILMLIKGNGFKLNETVLDKPLSPYKFDGEDFHHCQLINGPCLDFNVMTDRNYGKSTLSVLTPSKTNSLFIKAECDLKFIYDISSEILYKLQKNDTMTLECEKGSNYLVVNLTKL